VVDNVLIGRNLKGITDREGFSIEQWPHPDLGTLDQTDVERFLKRKEAVTLYLQGSAYAEIYAATGHQARHLNRLIRERCMHIHPDGRIYGWRGLVPGVHVVKYQRHIKVRATDSGRGTAGAMANLLQMEPDFTKLLDKQIVKTCPDLKLGEIRRPRHALWAWFLKELRVRGYETRNEWPFTVKSMGYMSLCRYADAVLSANPLKAARIAGGPQLEKKMVSGDGINRPVHQPYGRIEMDAHKLDGRFVVMIPQLDGGWSPRLIHRLWVIVLLDVASRAVIGYHLSLRVEVNKEDVIAAIKSALVRWSRRELSFSDQAYFEDAALPSGHHDRYVGLCWQETSVDGALAETCKTVKSKLLDVVGSSLMDPSVGFAQRRSKDDRPFIESFFKTLASRGLHRMSNTTGAKVQDKRGRDPAKVAVISEFQLEYAAELLDVLIANYNATPHSSLGYRSPLQMLDFQASMGKLPSRYADPNAVQGLLSVRKLCIVRGGYQQGRRPYVNFLGASYSNEELAQRHDLVGKPIWVINHLEDDARIALATTKDGHRLGILRAHPPWHRTPHSLSIRSAINAMVRNRRFALANGADAITVFMDFVESNANGKLPIHSSYLELKRLLVEHAQFRSSDAEVQAAKARIKDAVSDPDPPPENLPDPTAQVAIASKGVAKSKDKSQVHSKAQLPPMRKAAN
jgi:transposase InsO family protein